MMLQFIYFMPIILFDGVCNFCNRTVNTIITHDKRGVYQFAPAQSKVALEIIQYLGLDQQVLKTVVLIEDNHVFMKTDAVIRISGNLSGWPSYFKYIKYFPKPFRDACYDIIAKNRYALFGKRTDCMVPEASVRSRFIQ